MVSGECAAWTDTFSADLGKTYRNVIRINDEQAKLAVEELMERARDARATQDPTGHAHDDRTPPSDGP